MSIAPLLSFSTKKADSRPAPTVEIDGRAYRLRSREQLSFAQRLEHSRIQARMQALHPKFENKTCTPAEDAEYGALIRDLAALAVDAPATLTAGLDQDEQLVIVAAAFFGFRPGATAQTAGPVMKPRTPRTKRTGARSSRA
jgi:hypothetical protein